MVGLFLKLDGVQEFSLSTSNPLLASFNQDLVRLELLTSPTLAISRMTGERDLDGVFLFQPDGVFTALTDKGGVIFAGDFEVFRGLVGLLGPIS